MSEDSTNRRNVTIDADLEERICEAYPSASSTAQAIVLAAHDGVHIRESYTSCFEDRVRSIVRDELTLALAEED